MRVARRLARLAGRRSSPASATTCASSPSPKATKSPPRRVSAISVNGYGIGDLAEQSTPPPMPASTPFAPNTRRCTTWRPSCAPAALRHASLATAPASNSAFAIFLTEGGFKGFTTTFEMLHGLKQLPGLAVQRLMADGYGFGAEGDWKTCALLRAMKVIAGGKAHLLHGGLHLSSRSRRPPGPRLPHARGLSHPSPPASLPSKSTRSASAARKIPSASSSTRPPVPLSMPQSSISATASA